jgi:polyisoprenoid-binding protein YceI
MIQAIGIWWLMVQVAFMGIQEPLTRGKLVTREATVSIYAYGSLEPIRATNDQVGGTIDLDSNSFTFSIQTRAFEFKSKLMERHVHEEYLETGKFPEAHFKGTIMQPLMLNGDGDYEVTANGNFEIHGVVRPRTINGVITVKDGEMSLKSTFDIIFTEHNIKIPTLFFTDYATQVEVTLSSKLMQISSGSLDGK